MTKIYTAHRAVLMYPEFFKQPQYQGKDSKFGCKILLDPQNEKHAALIKELREDIAEIIQTELKLDRLPSDKVFVRNGDDLAQPWADNMYVVSVGVWDRPAPGRVYNAGMQNLNDDDGGLFYSGCIANVNFSSWVQKNEFGKRVNGNFEAVQWVAHGEKIAGGGVSDDEAAQGFEALDEDEAAFAGAQAGAGL